MKFFVNLMFAALVLVFAAEGTAQTVSLTSLGGTEYTLWDKCRLRIEVDIPGVATGDPVPFTLDVAEKWFTPPGGPPTPDWMELLDIDVPNRQVVYVEVRHGTHLVPVWDPPSAANNWDGVISVLLPYNGGGVYDYRGLAYSLVEDQCQVDPT